ncbi:Glucan endo-1,3-beta-glucosidase-like protein, partial [Drosera capensis]
QVRLFEPRADVLDALRGSGIKVSLGTRNEDLPSLAGNPAAAANWVRYWILPHKNNVYFGWITLGNELVPGGYAGYLVPAMNNMRDALIAVGLRYTKVSTSVPLSVLSASYPPSAGTFSSQTAGTMSQILSWLASTGNPIFLNCYPYFAYAAQPQQISFEYATFQSKTPVVIDGNFKYYNLFDAMLDAFIVAMQRTGHGNVQIVVSESGWPTAGQAPFTSPNNAKIYNQNMIYHVKNSGTPRRPRTKFDTFIFATFNENLKPGGIEQNWGIHYHDGQRAYPLYF